MLVQRVKQERRWDLMASSSHGDMLIACLECEPVTHHSGGYKVRRKATTGGQGPCPATHLRYEASICPAA